jgi:hypothetical protein
MTQTVGFSYGKLSFIWPVVWGDRFSLRARFLFGGKPCANRCLFQLALIAIQRKVGLVDRWKERLRVPGHLYGHLSCTKRQIPRVCAQRLEYNVGQSWRPEIKRGNECRAGDSYLEIKAASPTVQAPQSPLLALDPERPYCGRAIALRSSSSFDMRRMSTLIC